jgi:hypothetical protein
MSLTQTRSAGPLVVAFWRAIAVCTMMRPLREEYVTPLHHLADLADPFDYSTHINLLILATQLIAHGADVNAVSEPNGKAPLHDACYAGAVTNLDFIELLLERGADHVYHQACSRCGQISAELAYHGC